MTTNVAAFAAPGALSTLRSYLALTKPRIIALLLVTTVPAMVVADAGWPGTWLVAATLMGGTLSAGGANVINCWYDRDIDGIMRRTRGRPLVTGAIEPRNALAFGVALGVISFAFLWAATTLAAALLSMAALLFYVFVYTIWLKRRTSQNIVIGGAAGAFPPMVGWAAVTGDVGAASALMFAIIFMWTPPHFWALSLRLKDDYAEAGVPMLPVTNGPANTRMQIVLYSFALVATTLALLATGDVAWIYGIAAAALGGWFIWEALRLWRQPARVSPMSLYKYSLLYLALLFVAMGADAAILA
jgi:protoheme IX farnesyltransferase